MELVSCLIHHMISLYFLLLFVKSWLRFTFELHLIPKAIVTENGLRETCLGCFVVELGSYDMWKSIIQILHWLSGRFAWFLDWERFIFWVYPRQCVTSACYPNQGNNLFYMDDIDRMFWLVWICLQLILTISHPNW